MTFETLNSFLDLLKMNGWAIRLKGDEGLTPEGASGPLYHQLPESYKVFLRRVASCVNAAENVWFLCADDYSGKSSSAFSWNEFETMSLEAAEGDEESFEEVREFWSQHIPFLMSVKSDYAFLAFRVADDNHGSVVAGYAPDFEAVSPVCDSFDDFVDLHSAAVRGEGADTSLDDFV